MSKLSSNAFCRYIFFILLMLFGGKSFAASFVVTNMMSQALIVSINSPSCSAEYSTYGYPTQVLIPASTVSKSVEVLCGDDVLVYKAYGAWAGGYKGTFSIGGVVINDNFIASTQQVVASTDIHNGNHYFTSATQSQSIVVTNQAASGRTVGIQFKNTSNTWVKTVTSLVPGSSDTTNLPNISIVAIQNNGADSMCVYISSSPLNCWQQFPGSTRMYNHVAGDSYIIDKYVSPDCASEIIKWGSNNFCAGSAPVTPDKGTFGLTNTKAGASGSATASCVSGTWQVSSPSCVASMAAPSPLAATNGTVTNGINLTWGSVAGADAYRVQFRAQGASSWQGDLYAGAATSYNWTGLADEQVFEFQVRAENAVGSGAWSPVAAGRIRSFIDPEFVSQSGIPSKIGVGQSFVYTQVWKNNGSETWDGSAHGTSPYSPPDASVWGSGFAAFPGSTVTGESVTASLTAVAPSTPGTYPLQRIMQKSATAYGEASTAVSVQVIGAPICTGVSPDTAATYNTNSTITVTLQGASSVENAWIKVSGQNGGATAQYAMTLSGSTWTATFPIGAHLAPGETKINIQALVSNSLFTTQTECATNSVTFQQLPAPIVTLTPTIGSYTDAGHQGFVASRINGTLATATVDLGAFTGLKAKIEVVDGSDNAIVSPLTSVSHGVQMPVTLSNSTLAGITSAWTSASAVVRVSYADAAAASQGKVTEIPIEWMATPGALQVIAVPMQGLPQAVNSKIQDGAGAFSSSAQGPFFGGLRATGTAVQVSPFVPVEAAGEWSSGGLDYAQLYSTPMVAVARAEPPAGVTLLQPWEYVSAAFTLPVQAPAQVQATDGTREDDVEITWPAPATGASIRYRVFRDDTEITPPTGIPGTTVLDIPPERGVVYRYRVKTMVGSVTSENESSDDGHILACRAARFIGASLNAQMTAVTGMVESWACLEGLTGSGSIAPGAPSSVAFEGSGQYRSFVYPLEANLPDGGYVLRLNLESAGVSANSSRTYDIPFTLNRASISVNSLTILYNGTPAANGVETNSIGRFGIRMEGGSGIGFAEEVK